MEVRQFPFGLICALVCSPHNCLILLRQEHVFQKETHLSIRHQKKMMRWTLGLQNWQKHCELRIHSEVAEVKLDDVPKLPSHPYSSHLPLQSHKKALSCVKASLWQRMSLVWVGTGHPGAGSGFWRAWKGEMSQSRILVSVPPGCMGPNPEQRWSRPGERQLCSASSEAREELDLTPQPRSFLCPGAYQGPSGS